MNETEIIKGCIRKDRQSQKALYDRFASVMYAICLRYTHSRDNALDVLQDGFIKVYSSLESYKGEGNFEGWLKRIFINTAISYYHKIKTLADHFPDSEETTYNYSDEINIISKMSEKELLKLISKLPDGYRMVFNLYVIEGYDHEEIGKMLSINPGTSRSQLLKARRVLQQQLKDLKIIAA
ncbi:MAG: RNA polymerase sigma factor [Bacteroidetes bacterium]|nr:RNA polymerase sigma factor [Bacteroidota bacterium]